MDAIAKKESSSRYIALIPGIGLGDGLLFMPSLWNLVESGFRVKLFSSALDVWSDRLAPAIFCKTCTFECRKESVLQELENCDHIFIQCHSPAELLLKDHPHMTIVGKARWAGQTQAEAIDQAITTQLQLKPSFVEPLRQQLGFKPDVSNHRPCIAIHPTSTHPGKNWPLHQFLKVADNLHKQGYEVAFCLGKQENKLAMEITSHTLWFGLPLNDLCHRLANCQLLIGTDSGLGHLACLLGVPTLSIFQSKRHSLLWHPAWGANTVVLPAIPVPGFIRKHLWKYCLWPTQVLFHAKKILRRPHD